MVTVLDWTSSDDGNNSDDNSAGEPAVESVHVKPRGVNHDEAGPSRPSLIPHFVAMGFAEELVEKAIQSNEEGDENAILQWLLNCGADMEGSASRGENFPHWSSSDSSSLEGDESDFERVGDVEEEEFAKRDEKLAQLVEMGYPHDAAASAIKRCGEDASILELTDFMYAADMAGKTEDNLPVYPDEAESFIVDNHVGKKRRRMEEQRKRPKKPVPNWEDSTERCFIPKPMIGYGVPGQVSTRQRNIPETAQGPPYFYYENVALAPSGVWKTISDHLFKIEPEFVDSKFFCATARKRGYIHNLPIKNRFPLFPIPAKTISDAFPENEEHRPDWDDRIHFNCLQTCTASATVTQRIREKLSGCSDPPPRDVRSYVLDELRTWNLVWVGRHVVAPLEPDEMEKLLGFPRDHTRGINRTERRKSLGNSFQIDTVAYHLSVLRDMFPEGMRVLSLFSGIGGAEVALDRLQIPLKVVVSVEISQSSRNVLRSWWDQTQHGTLIHLDDVQQVTKTKLEELCNRFGGFDLVIGGSPCNNLAGSNRHHRVGLEGDHSSLFFDYSRILEQVKDIMRRNS